MNTRNVIAALAGAVILTTAAPAAASGLGGPLPSPHRQCHYVTSGPAYPGGPSTGVWVCAAGHRHVARVHTYTYRGFGGRVTLARWFR